MVQIRIKYAKTNAGRFLSHLDLMRAWERSIRRSGLPLAFSQGFNPHPKISFSSALSVGVTSNGEYMDMELTEAVELTQLKERLTQNLPPALMLLDAQEITQKTEALMAVIDRARYQLSAQLTETISETHLAQLLSDFWAQDVINVLRFKKNSRNKREVNIRPSIFALTAKMDGDCLQLEMLVQTGSTGNVRPDEVVLGLMSVGLPIVNEIMTIHREGLYVAKDNDLVSPFVFC